MGSGHARLQMVSGSCSSCRLLVGRVIVSGGLRSRGPGVRGHGDLESKAEGVSETEAGVSSIETEKVSEACKAWNVIYTVGILVVLACSVLLAAVTSLPRRARVGAHSSSVKKLNIDIDAMLKDVDFAIRGGEEEMMAKKGDVEKGIESLKEKADWCDGEIRREAAKILETIMKDM